MRHRNAVTALLITMIGLLTGALVGLFACDRPQAAGPDPGPGSATPAPDPTPDGGRAAGSGSTKAGGSGKSGGSRKTSPTPTRTKTRTSKPPTEVTQYQDLTPPRIRNTSVANAGYYLSDDGQALSIAFDNMQVGQDGSTTKTFTVTVPLSGDTAKAVIEFGAVGYVASDESSTAALTMAVCGRSERFTFRTGFDDDFVRNFAVPLHGARNCAVKLTVEVRGSAAVAGIQSLEAQFI